MEKLLIAIAGAALIAAMVAIGYQYIECREAGGELLRGLCPLEAMHKTPTCTQTAARPGQPDT